MASPSVNTVHVASTTTSEPQTKPKVATKLTAKQLAAILNRVATLMIESDDASTTQPTAATTSEQSTKPTSKIAKQLTCENCGKDITSNVQNDMEAEATLCDTCRAELMKSETTVAIFAKTDERQIAYGVAYPAKPLGWSDTQGDWIQPAEIELMAHNYMLKSRQYDINHARLASYDEAQIVESYIAPADFTLNGHAITKGSWIVATYFPRPEAWAAVKAGKIQAYSIKGRGKRTRLTPMSSADQT